MTLVKSLALSRVVKRAAEEIGFDACGIAKAQPTPQMDLYEDALRHARHGEMSYLVRHQPIKEDLKRFLPGAKSVLVCAASYNHRQENPGSGGIIARYARGRDYHKILPKRVRQLMLRIQTDIACEFGYRVFCDAQPVHERVWAQLAGIGWMGKNTLILNRKLGSYFLLCGAVTDLELAPDDPVKNYCGGCRKCLDACPTNALYEPYKLDARRCVSYLTIEHKGEISPELSAKVGRRVFGCDICQEVCPWNSKSVISDWDELGRGRVESVDLLEMSRLSQQSHRELFSGTALVRAKPEMWRRTAQISVSEKG